VLKRIALPEGSIKMKCEEHWIGKDAIRKVGRFLLDRSKYKEVYVESHGQISKI